MAFLFSLVQAEPVVVAAETLPPSNDYALYSHEQNQEIEQFISDACKILARPGDFLFSICGFGQDHWPLDVATDLMVFVEQFEDLVRWTYKTSEPCLLVFYEQGVERSLTFCGESGDIIGIECHSWGDWIPQPAVERVALPVLKKMMLDFLEQWSMLVQERADIIYWHPVFNGWLTKMYYDLRIIVERS
jgi:hypothetical protein